MGRKDSLIIWSKFHRLGGTKTVDELSFKVGRVVYKSGASCLLKVGRVVF